MDLNAVALFIKVIECKSFSKASEKTGVSTSSISRKVSELEASLNIQLIERTTRKLRLTEDGRIFFEKSQSAINALDVAKFYLLDNKFEDKGTLRISVPVGLEQSIIVPLLEKFQKKFPEVRLKVLASSIKVDFVEDGIDVALRVGELKDSNNIAHTLLEYEHILVTSPSYINKNNLPKHPENLSDYHLISATNWHDDNQWGFRKDENEIVLNIDESLSLNHYAAIQAAAEGGMGIAELPSINCVSALKEKKLIHVLPSWKLKVYERERLKLSIIYTANRYNSKLIKNFKSFCLLYFDNMAE